MKTVVKWLFVGLFFVPNVLLATSNMAKKTGLSCTSCHNVFPRLNAFGENYMRNGFQLMREMKEEPEEFEIYSLSDMLGIRLNLSPVTMKTNAFMEDSNSSKSAKFSVGNPNWLQLFASGSIFRNVSFFSELEYKQDDFHFSWFYFGFHNLFDSRMANLQVGNISPMEFTSMANRLRIMANVKGLVQGEKTKGEEGSDMSSSRAGIQYYGYSDFGVIYAGISPGKKDVNQFMDSWVGINLNIPEGLIDGFDRSNLTLHYYMGTDTKNTGVFQIENAFTRFSPQLNIRYDDKIDLQFAYVMAEDDNRGFKTGSGISSFKYSGVSFQGTYLFNPHWNVALAYDEYSSDDSTMDVRRIVPQLQFTANENFHLAAYYEADLVTDDPVNTVYLNIRTMF